MYYYHSIIASFSLFRLAVWNVKLIFCICAKKHKLPIIFQGRKPLTLKNQLYIHPLKGFEMVFNKRHVKLKTEICNGVLGKAGKKACTENRHSSGSASVLTPAAGVKREETQLYESQY